MSQVDMVGGLTGGDEGKGKVTDFLAENYDAIVRFQGGNNAGHTIKIGEEIYKLHLIPCGILTPGKLAVIGNGCVVDPKIMLGEINGLHDRSISTESLKLSNAAHIILSYHRALDSVQEVGRTEEEKIGSTRRGIGPAYSSKISRQGVRVQDLLDKEALRTSITRGLIQSGIQDRLRKDLKKFRKELSDEEIGFIEESLDLDGMAETYYGFGQELKQYIADTNQLLWGLLDSGKNILCEGAQGMLLDIDHGSYPFVTSSNIVPGAISTGAGIPPQKIKDVYGVVKSFVTRIDTVGHFPTWDQGEVAEDIIERGGEFGTTTGRRRRFGWLDLVMVRYSVRLAGVNNIAVTKMDILSGVKELKVATAYELPDGTKTTHYPTDGSLLRQVKPVYETIEGWDEDISGVRKFEDLPAQAKEYLRLIEEHSGAPVTMIGVGQERSQIIRRDA